MKKNIFFDIIKRLCKSRCIMAISVMLLTNLSVFAYVTVPSSSYTAKVGEVLYIYVPDATRGYIDHAVWACSSPYINFIKKDDVGAQIQVTKEFTGTAIVELLYVEKYLDNNNQTRAITYYKEFKICCSSEGKVNPTSISFPKTEVKIGDIVEIVPTVKPSNATVTYKSYTTKGNGVASIWVDWNNNILKARGVAPGTATATIETTNGKTATVTVTVPRPQTGSGIIDNNGNVIYDANLTKAITNMENLFTKTLQNKK